MNDDPAIETDLVKIEQDIWTKRENYTQEKHEIIKFIRTAHNSKKTSGRLLDIRERKIEIDEITDTLENPKLPAIYKEKAEQLLSNCDVLYNRNKDIEDALSDDLAAQLGVEGRSRTQFISTIVPILSITAAFVAIAKAASGDISVLLDATVAGVTTSLVIVYHEDIRDALKTSKEAICDMALKEKLGNTLTKAEEAGSAKVYDIKKAGQRTASQVIEAKREAGKRLRNVSPFKRYL